MRLAVPLPQQTLHRTYTPTSTREESLAISLVVAFRGSATSLEQPDFRPGKPENRAGQSPPCFFISSKGAMYFIVTKASTAGGCWTVRIEGCVMSRSHGDRMQPTLADCGYDVHRNGRFVWERQHVAGAVIRIKRLR